MSIFIIAEIGINHNGSIKICKELIDIAADAGCDAVKLQKRDIDLVYSQEFLDTPRDSPWGKTQRDQKMGLEFNEEEYKDLIAYTTLKGLDIFASAWDIKSQQFLNNLDVKYNKIASAMIVHEELLHLVAKQKRHTFISTGMSEYHHIDKAVEIFRQHSCSFELMHAVSTYPMKDEDANLNCIANLKDKYQCNVGYSGHEVGLAVSCAASALGITSLERHITLDRAMYGSDQPASLEPNGLRQLVGSVKKIEQALGSGIKGIIKEEISIAEKLRGHIPYVSDGTSAI